MFKKILLSVFVFMVLVSSSAFAAETNNSDLVIVVGSNQKLKAENYNFDYKLKVADISNNDIVSIQSNYAVAKNVGDAVIKCDIEYVKNKKKIKEKATFNVKVIDNKDFINFKVTNGVDKYKRFYTDGVQTKEMMDIMNYAFSKTPVDVKNLLEKNKLSIIVSDEKFERDSADDQACGYFKMSMLGDSDNLEELQIETMAIHLQNNIFGAGGLAHEIGHCYDASSGYLSVKQSAMDEYNENPNKYGEYGSTNPLEFFACKFDEEVMNGYAFYPKEYPYGMNK